MVLRCVVYRHGELLRLVAKLLEDDMPNDAVAGDGDETVTALMVGRRELDSLLVTDPAGGAKEAQSAAASRQLGVEALERDGVVGRDPTDSDVVVNHAPMVRVATRVTRVPWVAIPSGHLAGSPIQVEPPRCRKELVPEVRMRDRDQCLCALGHGAPEQLSHAPFGDHRSDVSPRGHNPGALPQAGHDARGSSSGCRGGQGDDRATVLGNAAPRMKSIWPPTPE